MRTALSLDDEDNVEFLCEEIASGKGVNEAAQAVGINESTVYRRMAKDAAFASRIARAREAQQEYEIERTVAMADAATPEDYNVVKLRIWARQWRAAKLVPKKYGDKTTVGGDPENPLKHEVSYTDDQRAAALLALIAKTKAVST